MTQRSLNMVSATAVRVVEMKNPDYYEQIKPPGGALVRDTSLTDLFAMLERLNLPGFSHSMAVAEFLENGSNHDRVG